MWLLCFQSQERLYREYLQQSVGSHDFDSVKFWISSFVHVIESKSITYTAKGKRQIQQQQEFI